MIDIETKPDVVYTWSYFNTNIGIEQVIETGGMICFAARWLGSDKTMYFSDHDMSHLEMVKKAHELLDEADIVMTYYGSRFDVPHLNREFLENGLLPPSPYRQIDLKMAVGKAFRFSSNKLQFISEQLELSGKIQHEGFRLWRDCIAGDDEAWRKMKEYNMRDVVLLEELYFEILPWIPSLPNLHLYDGDSNQCPSCGTKGTLQEAGYAYTPSARFEQFRCDNCGGYFRSNKRNQGSSLRRTVL